MAEGEKCSYTAMQLQDGHLVQPVCMPWTGLSLCTRLEKQVEIAAKSYELLLLFLLLCGEQSCKLCVVRNVHML